MGLVVKVKYEGTLRRFSIYISEDGRPDISLNALRYKICDLFKFNLNSDIIITYIDEDNDVINMVDEDDLVDAIRQRLNPLRLEVSFTDQKGVGAAMRSSNETSSLKTYAIPKGNNQTSYSESSVCSDKTLKDLPELLLKTHITDNPFLKSVTPTLNMEEIIDSSSKRGATADSLTEGCQGLGPCSDTQANNGATHTLNEQGNGSHCKFQAGHHNLYGPSAPPLSIETRYNHNCHHGPESLSGPSISSIYRDVSSNGLRKTTMPSKATLRTFHKGVQCDGCGMSPIVGPRYASKIKDNYDLCLACFSKMGNGHEYTKIVDPSENVLPKFSVPCDCCVTSPGFYPFYSSKMGFGPEVAADRLRIAHSRDLYMPQRIYTEGLANQGKLFDSDDTMSPSYSWSQRSPISSFQSSVRKMDNKSPRKLNCCFVKDVTVCDGAQLAPGTHFTKIWRLHNTGTRPWPQHTLLVRIGGVDFGAGNEVKLEIEEKGCPVDEDFDAVVHGIAPMQAGYYVSYWRLMAPSGEMFGQQVWVFIQVVKSSKEGFLPLPLKSSLTTEHPDENAGSFQGKNKERLFGVDICFNEGVLAHPMKSVLTTKDTDGNAVPFQGQSKPKLFGVDIAFKDSGEKANLSDDNLNLKLSNLVKIPDGASMIEQPVAKASILTVQDLNIPVAIPDGASMTEQPGEKAYGVSWMDTTFMPSTVRGNSLLSVPVHGTVGKLDVFARAPSLVMSDINSYSGKYPADIKQMEQRKLYADVLRKKSYGSQEPLDAPLNAAVWDPILDELQEMVYNDYLWL